MYLDNTFIIIYILISKYYNQCIKSIHLKYLLLKNLFQLNQIINYKHLLNQHFIHVVYSSKMFFSIEVDNLLTFHYLFLEYNNFFYNDIIFLYFYYYLINFFASSVNVNFSLIILFNNFSFQFHYKM